MTTYNRRELLKETLASIAAQTWLDYEVLVGNDYPEERLSGDLLGLTDRRIQFINHSQNLGELNNMNALLKESRGRYFTWLADDDLYAPTFLEAVYATLVKCDYPPCVFTSYMAGTLPPDSLDTPVREGDCFEGRKFLQLYLCRTLKTQGCYGVFDARYLRATGGMEQLGQGFSPYADNLLVIKASVMRKVAYIDSPLVFYRIHEGSVSATSIDLDAYQSAQESLCSKSIQIFKSDGLRETLQSNLFLLLQWCIRDFVAVLRRSRCVDRDRIVAYLRFIRTYISLLKGSVLYCRAIALLCKAGCRVALDAGRAKYGRKLRLVAEALFRR